MYVTYCVIPVVIPGFSPFLLTVMILDGGVGGNSRFFDHVTCPLFLPQPDERGVPEPNRPASIRQTRSPQRWSV